MGRRMAAWVVAAGLVAAGGALAHEEGGHGTATDGHAHGRADSFGEPGDSGAVTRDVAVEMDDSMRFRPETIRAKRGETIRFVVTNAGAMRHEMVLGTPEGLREHAERMRRIPEMEHADPNQVTVAPGRTGELIWRFTRTGTVPFACLQPGHFEAGMVGRVVVGEGADAGASGSGSRRTGSTGGSR